MKKVGSASSIVGWSFFIIGVVFAAIGVMMHVHNTNFKENALTTNGTIIDIRTYTDSDGDTSHDVFVEYYVDGVLYDGELNYYTSSMEEGDSVKIYYDPNNPGDFIGEDSTVGLIIFVIIGSVFALIGIGFVASAIITKSKRKRVLGYNFIVQANISGFNFNKNVTINGVHPYILTATIISPYDGLIYTFKSESIMTDLTPILQAYNIKTVPVYVNPQNYKEYYVDIDFFKRYLGN